jgi:hypothetical protein
MGVLDSHSQFSRMKARLGFGIAKGSVVSEHLLTSRLREEVARVIGHEPDLYAYFLRIGAIVEKTEADKDQEKSKRKKTVSPTHTRPRVYSQEWLAKREELRRDRRAEEVKTKLYDRIITSKQTTLQRALALVEENRLSDCILYLLSKGRGSST